VFEPDVLSQTIAVYHNNTSTTVVDGESIPIGTLSQFATDFLSTISTDDAIEIQIQCHPIPTQYTRRKRSTTAASTVAASVIIYGEFELFDEVGIFCDESGIFLQDPVGCDRVVEYRNPHRLSGFDNETTLTSIGDPAVSTTEKMSPVDFLSGFENGALLPETADPFPLRTGLHKHQRQALAFMLAREKGWQFDISLRDVWSQETCITGRWSVYFSLFCGVVADQTFQGILITSMELAISTLPRNFVVELSQTIWV
jgi:hypothetical protein